MKERSSFASYLSLNEVKGWLIEMADERVINKILSEYENLRIAAANERKERIESVYKNFPEIKEIDAEINRLGFQNMNNIMTNPEKKDEYNSDFHNKLKILTDRKNKILSENNIDTDYDKYNYKCKICSDTGYDENGDKCVCFKQKLINAAYSMSNMEDMVKKQNFDNFLLDYYPSEKTDEGISPRENIEKILNNCKRFCKNFETENKSLFFYGATGLGKTFLSSAIAKEIMDSGKTVVYVRATKLFTIYEEYRFGKNSDKSIIDNIYNCDLLIIDDLGTEMNSANNFSFLFDVINDRISNNKKMIINTNLSLGEITGIYSNRFTSRLYEFFNMYKFYGEDIRLQKLKNGR